MVNARTTTTMATPGGTSHHQFPAVAAPALNAPSRMVPHDTLVGSPSPRNDSVLSERMAMATRSTVLAKIMGPTLGRMCLVVRCQPPAPRARARST
jgi:hypothetical protein